MKGALGCPYLSPPTHFVVGWWEGRVVGLGSWRKSPVPAESSSRLLAGAPTMTTPAFLPTSPVLTLLGRAGSVS